MHHLIAYTNKSLAYLLEHSGYEVFHMSPYPNNDKIFGQLGFDSSASTQYPILGVNHYSPRKSIRLYGEKNHRLTVPVISAALHVSLPT